MKTIPFIKPVSYLLGLILLLSPLQATQTITLQLKWFHQFQFAGYYAAIEKGYYAKEGLDVKLIERDPHKNNIMQVINGEALYGIADSSLLFYRAKGYPVKLLASIFQHSPLIFIARRDSQILSPLEMKGKKLMIERNLDDAPLAAMLADAGLDPQQYITLPQSFNPNDLIDGKVDAMEAYLTDQPFYFKQRNFPITIINPLNYGIDFYGDNLFTTETEITNHPERVEKLVRATLRGWNYALRNPDEIIDLILTKYGSKLPKEHLQYEASSIRQMMVADMVEIGYTSPERFERIGDVYVKMDFFDKKTVAESLKHLIYQPDTQSYWVKYRIIILSGFGTLIVLAFLLFFINRRLRKLITQKTQQLEEQLEEAHRNELLLQEERDLFIGGPTIIMRWNTRPGWGIEYVSPNVETILGYKPEELTNGDLRLAHLVHPDDLKAISADSMDMDLSQWEETYRIRDKKGQYRWFYDFTIKVKQASDGPIHLRGYLVDIHERKLLEQPLENSLAYEKTLFASNAVGILISSDSRLILNVNSRLCELFGYDKSELINHSTRHFHLDDNAYELLTSYILRILNSTRPLELEYRFKHAQGNTIWCTLMGVSIMLPDKTRGIMWSFIDITKRKELEEQLQYLATTDPLTQLANRRAFMGRLAEELGRIRRYNVGKVSLLMIDIDHFKLVNDHYGHACGDEVLQLLANTLRMSLRTTDIAGRLGGEEFSIILPETPHEQALIFAERLRQCVSETPMRYNTHTITITISIGLTLLSTTDIDSNAPLARADQALYKAKANGRNRVEIIL